ncbi:MAG: hypothetical protein B6U65_01355 [Candidatus Wolframiiraptor sp. EX4484-121]|nr:MAG: hypothetical protein B6U65_01355 [Candidatus Wolframiiraptor sp. EX4484-121]
MTVEMIFALIFLLIILLIFTEAVHRSLAAILGALLITVFGLLYRVFRYEEILGFLDLHVILFILGLFILFEVLREVGLFRFIGIALINLTRSPTGYMIIFCILSMLFAAIIDNIPAMLIIGSLIITISKELKIDPTPYIIASAIFTNIGGIMLLISSIPNILVGHAFNITFTRFAEVSAPLAPILALVTLAFFVKYLTPKEGHPLPSEVRYDPWTAVKDRKSFELSTIIFIATMVALTFHEKLMVGMEFIVLGSAIAIMVLTKMDVGEIFKRLDWPTLLFLTGFFIVVGGLNKVGLLKLIANSITSACPNQILLATIFTWLTGFASAFIDNIPLTMTFIPVTQAIIMHAKQLAQPLIWGLVFGANLGGNLTPIGSPSNIVALGILERSGCKGFFRRFFKIGAIAALIHLALANLYIFLRFILKLWP